MKIGVFGDSFADRNLTGQGPWFDYLKEYHDVFLLGSGGSSITYSAYKILESYQNYDLVIWCVTNPFRNTTKIDSPRKGQWWCHVNSFGNIIDPIIPGIDPSADEKKHIDDLVQTSQKFIKDFWFWPFAVLESRALVHYLQSEAKNIMIIPCFEHPMEVGVHCLTQISKNEFRHLSVEDFYKKMSCDDRICHMSSENNQRLGTLVLNNLKPGILHLSPDEFC